MGSYFTHVSRLVVFDMDDVVSFNIKYFFILWNLFTKDSIYLLTKNSTRNDNKCCHHPTINN